jgi:fatty acid desaturase
VAQFQEFAAMNPPISKQGYFELRSRLSFHQLFWPTGLVMLADAALLALACYLVGMAMQRLDTVAGITGYVLGQLLFVLVFFHNFAVLHECGHGNCSRREWVNSLVGHIASVFCFMPYFPWKYIHAEHHTWAGNIEKDPTLRLVRNYEKSQHAKNWVIRAAWRTWVPLLALFQHVVFWTFPLVLLKEGRLHGQRLRRSAFSVLLLVGTYTVLGWFFGSWFSLATFGPALLIYLVVVELVNFPHHMGTQLFEHTERGGKLPLWQHNEVTRTCYYPPMISDLLFLNFNFHVEHHLFPDLPWFRLHDARPIAKQALGGKYIETIGINWNLENRTKDATKVFLTDRDGDSSHWNLQVYDTTKTVAAKSESDEDYERFLRQVRLEQSEMYHHSGLQPGRG